ncbi:hypothetical protein AMELA_G00242220 [Ameiurus melas]|uniref:Ig-like domain-containing protein n=1 Tax=Ameiurus melas TaxID=219545 RepID=A0A7J5ZVP5_AMEME|nr:hypothetical protein AMELA_G00242220 [Ameiurus melas]
MKDFHHTEVSVQSEFVCDGDDGYMKISHDNVSITFHCKNETWIPSNGGATAFMDTDYARNGKSILHEECRYWDKQRKVPPTASVFQKHSSSPEVVCHATGFFPKPVMITWQKDGEDVYEDVDLGETLPNQDGSFQKRSILTVSVEDLQKHTYTCVIQHSSLEKEIVLHEEDIRILNPGGAPIGIIVGVVAALVVLVAVVAGIGSHCSRCCCWWWNCLLEEELW